MDAAPTYLVKPWPGPSPENLQYLLNDMHGQGYQLDATLTDGKTYYLVFKRSSGQP